MARPRVAATTPARSATPKRATTARTTPQVKSKDRATSSVAARRAVLKRIKDEKIEHVLFWFTDLEGHLKSFAITPNEMADALDDGMGFDGSSITGFNAIEESDMVAIPDPLTFQVMPRPLDETGQPVGAKVGRMICDVVKPDGVPYEGDPRFILKLALERMKKLGFDTFNVGPELEYFLFEDERGTETIDEGGYFAMTVQDAATEVRNDTIQALESVGIQIEYHHHEVAPSQHEIDMRYDNALSMADKTMTYRIVVKEVATWHGYYATFMPKPLFGENGSGMHTHMSLFKGGRNMFFDAKDPNHLSKTAKSFIAGLLVHAREMSSVLAQWVNSYKRLVPGYEAPVYVAWSQRNRSALIRIPLYKPGAEQATRAEIRCPDPACNPYLAFAALLHAGLEGIERGYELPEEMTTNLYRLTPEERVERGIVALPGSLGEATEELAGSDLLKKALGDHIFPRYVEIKRKEWDEYRVQVSQWELDNYLKAL
jgi:glutamine synthetase